MDSFFQKKTQGVYDWIIENRKTVAVTMAIFAVFILLRLAVLPQMYHQDEYKWGEIVDPSFGLHFESDHPPLVSVLYLANGLIAGFNHLRLLPFFVSIVNLILVFFIARKLYRVRAAIISTAILAVSVYSVIAGTQVDIDGALLPLPFLLAILAYINGQWERPFAKGNRKWLALLFGALIFGFLIKLSFVLAIGAIFTDYFIIKRFKIKEILKAAILTIVAVVIVGVTILIIDKIFGVANSGRFLANTEKFGFLNFGSRNYFQVLFLGVKSLILASPLLIAPIILAISKGEYIRKFRLWLIFIGYNLLFYLVIFDFTNRTIERYMMFIIIPAVIIAGAIFSELLFKEKFKWHRGEIMAGLVSGALAIFVGISVWLSNLPALPLNPKSAYLSKIFHLDFNFLIPITGGSGPIGFYVPVSFIVLFFVAVFFLIVAFKFIKNQDWQRWVIIGFIGISLIYNGFLLTEFISGYFFGNVDRVAKETMGEVIDNSKIDKVITYYDIGGYELNVSGKYGRRFYTDPMFAETNKGKFQDFKSYFAVVDFPMVDKDSVYWAYFKTCKQIYSVSDKKVNGYIFDCQNGNRDLFTAEN